ncbi:nuclear transport factor 2 family protein [Geodermatophilus marinus]|uniref:nuclear transport factor 2 family protein n=1 Tax=Geodermatophilus sp. LHW52908 TaxID=2303986 RepID=UPI000E3CB0BB|nr:nuclear transport factor 2 family protein [Geodermatophilus sp. LHW52908]RFU19147.1 nuclear transport factor 2 family protein [Geodermatophilus sp. LHW52908]
MDIVGQTSVPELSADSGRIARQVGVLAARAAITDLNALYMMAVDDHDIEGVLACFAPDGSFTRLGGTVSGHAALRDFYVGMMDRYVTTLHVPNSHVVRVGDENSATGVVTGHAELSLAGTLMMAAFRYPDRYRRVDSQWVFQDRSLRFMYVTPFSEMASTFTGPARIRWPEAPPVEADIPEQLPTWRSYRS